MKNRKGQPICGKTVTGPIVKDGGRSRPLWRDNCRRVVKDEADYCWQHGGRKQTTTDTAAPNEHADRVTESKES